MHFFIYSRSLSEQLWMIDDSGVHSASYSRCNACPLTLAPAPQLTSTVLMVRPACFGFNPLTATDNVFQHCADHTTPDHIRLQARVEFEAYVASLRSVGVAVHVVEDTPDPVRPDAVFPNNWLSTHADGTVVTYPMCAPNRRTERRDDVIQMLERLFVVTRFVDMTAHEDEGRFLEGTGSIVIDHVTSTAYASLGTRTDPALFSQWCATLGLKGVSFHACDDAGHALYHTNVVMCVGAAFAVVCLDAIRDPAERAAVHAALAGSKDIIEISVAQMMQFAGNMLHVQGRDGTYLVMSRTALHASPQHSWP